MNVFAQTPRSAIATAAARAQLLGSTEPLADPIPVAAARCGISRSLLYVEIKAGRIVTKKVGGRTIVERAEMDRWLASLPQSAAA